MRNKVIAGLLIAALLAGGSWWWTNRSSSTKAASANRVVEVAVERGDIQTAVTGSGPVTAVNGVTVKANQSGTIVAIHAKDGDEVKAGQVILELENKTLQASLKQSQLDVQNNESNLNTLLNPQATSIRAQELKLENARLTLQQRQEDMANLRVTAPIAGVVLTSPATQGGTISNNGLLFTLYDESTPTLLVKVPQNEARYLMEGISVKVSLPGLGRSDGRVEQVGGAATPTSGNQNADVPVRIALPPINQIRPGMVGEATFEVKGLSYRIIASGTVENDATEVRAKVAGTAGPIAVQVGDQVEEGSLLLTIESEGLATQLAQAENDVKTQEQNLANLLNPAQDPSQQLLTTKQKLEQSRLTLSSRMSDVDDLMVKAPVGGQISSLNLKVGDKVTNNAPLFRVADYKNMQVTITVDELDVARIKPGMEAEVILDALPGRKYKGTVLKINPEGVSKNDIANFEVTVAIQKPDGLMAGMNATVTIIVAGKKDVLWLPAQAVQVRQGKAMVQVMQPGSADPVPREIKVGLRTTDKVEVAEGLSQGEKVVLTIVKANANQMRLPFGNMGGGGGNPQGPAGNQAPAPAPAPANEKEKVKQPGGQRP